MNYNILVTGCGGDIGQSIGKILKEYDNCALLVGCDLSDQNPACFIYDNFKKISAISSSNYLAEINAIIKEYSIDIIIPVSEPELRFYTNNKSIQFKINCPVLMANLKAREIGFDKLETVNFLKKEGLSFPQTALFEDVKNPKFPFLIKSRFGSGSKALFIIKNKLQYNFYKEVSIGFIAQELLENDNEEYTCGLFRDKSGNIKYLILRRTLMDGGHSGYGEVVENKQIEDLLVEIAIKIQLEGSINVQLRLTTQGPIVFEINPRFSSTVKFRHIMGFQDLIWSLEDFFNLPISTYIAPKIGTKFYKGFMEYVK
jgi:carbamoyl-phosphate synthase large subunit